MEPVSRHRCLIYEGAPSRQLASLAAALREKLTQNYRCLYLNSRPMVAGMRSYLAAAGVDVTQEINKKSLVLSSEQDHLVDGQFDIDQMMNTLANALDQALKDGYAGLWATGDMTWEMGPDKNFSKLVEYEQRLEEFFHEHPEMGGICQYHADTLPFETVRDGYLYHRSLFINETLTLVNPHSLVARPAIRRKTIPETTNNPGIDAAILRLCHSDAIE
jgi:MEDS: MEthanogen/methylotroph, DcmR Sensory domain